MTLCLEEFIHLSSSMTDPDALLRLYLKTISDEGYQNAAFVTTRACRLASVQWTHLPTGYTENYTSCGWDKIDPIIQLIASVRQPIHWQDIRERTPITPRQRQFLDECQELGVHSGITIPLHGPGPDVDLISISLRDEKRIENAKFRFLYTLTSQYHLRLYELTDAPEVCYKPLTPREVECLRWCKEGKTNWEIGEIMMISEKTVEFHVSSLIKKLGASNRISAVIKGIYKGIV